MTRNALRWVALVAVALAGPAFAQVSRGGGDEPNQETLKRLAQQLGTGTSQLPQNIDPELMKLAADYLKKNPDILNDPAFQKQVEQLKKQAKENPEQFKELVKKQNPNLSQQQIDELKKQFDKSNSNPNPGGFQPPPGFPQPKPPQPGQPPTPPDVTRPPVTPGQPPVQPGQPPPGQPPTGQFPPPQPGQPSGGTPSGQPGQGGQPQTAADKAQGKEEYQQVVGMWENTFGDIEKTPALKQSLIDMFSGDGKNPWGNGNGKAWDGSGKNGTGKSPFDNGNGSNGGSQNGFINWLKSSTSSPPSWWKNMTAGGGSTGSPPSVGGSGFNAPSAPSGGMGGVSVAGLGGAGLFALVLVLVVVLAVVGFLIYRYWPQIQARLQNKPKAIPGLGPWTIDPRDVVDRETLVKAFEYLSVLICGDGARVWNHQTIADAFRDNVPGAAPFADPLARLYALARYSPAHEPIAQADIAEARGYLCRLAGVRG